MKFLLILFLSFTMIIYIKAGGDKYTTIMEKNISLIDSGKSLADFQQLSNSFERIASAEKSKWIPFYYAAYCYAIASFIDSSTVKKDVYLDQADKLIKLADSLSPDNSEIYTLNGLVNQARLLVNPMERWQKYGTLSSSLLKKAKELNPANPRPDYLIGQSVLYTPEAFGGGKDKAMPYFEESKKKFEEFNPESSISPNWGKSLLLNILDRISTSK
jgi:hypothetical protein